MVYLWHTQSWDKNMTGDFWFCRSAVQSFRAYIMHVGYQLALSQSKPVGRVSSSVSVDVYLFMHFSCDFQRLKCVIEALHQLT